MLNCDYTDIAAPPISNEHCPYLWGIFPISADCHISYYKCEEGNAVDTPCEPGLVYDDRSHTCNWPDQLENCNPEGEFCHFDTGQYVNSDTSQFS